MCDVDFFKNYNDSYGHQMGDDCLCEIARLMDNSFKRSGELPARYGGEEFAVIIPGLSIGMASLLNDEHINIRALIEWADEALYQAKEKGRNQVVVYQNVVHKA